MLFMRDVWSHPEAKFSQSAATQVCWSQSLSLDVLDGCQPASVLTSHTENMTHRQVSNSCGVHAMLLSKRSPEKVSTVEDHMVHLLCRSHKLDLCPERFLF